MNSFTIRDIVNLTGIKAHTLRVWETRYGILTPTRKQSNHRLYGIEDLKKMLRISYLYHQGYKISRIAEMDEDQIKAISLDYKADKSYDKYINQLMEASMDFDEPRFKSVVENAIQQYDVENFITQVIYPFLKKIGLFWMTGNVIPCQEHFASNIIRNKLLVAINNLPQKKWPSNRSYLLFNPPNEFHEIPLLIVQYFLKQKGISNVLFGTNAGLDELKLYMERNKVTHLFLFLTTNFTNMEPSELLEHIEHEFPDLKIEGAGHCFQELEPPLKNRVKIFSTVPEFIQYIHLLNPEA